MMFCRILDLGFVDELFFVREAWLCKKLGRDLCCAQLSRENLDVLRCSFFSSRLLFVGVVERETQTP
jgi:hypothetical protein